VLVSGRWSVTSGQWVSPTITIARCARALNAGDHDDRGRTTDRRWGDEARKRASVRTATRFRLHSLGVAVRGYPRMRVKSTRPKPATRATETSRGRPGREPGDHDRKMRTSPQRGRPRRPRTDDRPAMGRWGDEARKPASVRTATRFPPSPTPGALRAIRSSVTVLT